MCTLLLRLCLIGRQMERGSVSPGYRKTDTRQENFPSLVHSHRNPCVNPCIHLLDYFYQLHTITNSTVLLQRPLHCRNVQELGFFPGHILNPGTPSGG